MICQSQGCSKPLYEIVKPTDQKLTSDDDELINKVLLSSSIKEVDELFSHRVVVDQTSIEVLQTFEYVLTT